MSTPIDSNVTVPNFNDIIALNDQSSSSVTKASQTSKVDPDALQAIKDANAVIEKSISKLEARLDDYDKERKGYLATLAAPPPSSMKMTADQYTDIGNQISAHMSYWNNGANDRHGHNDRETKAINNVDGALRDNAKYLTYDQAIAMLATADANGLQSNGGNFEDGSWQKTFDSVRDYAGGAKQIFSQDMAAWKNAQSAAKAGLGNVTGLLNSVQNSINSELTTLNNNIGQLQQMIDQSIEQSKNNVNLTNFNGDAVNPVLPRLGQNVKVSVGLSGFQPQSDLASIHVNVQFA